MLFRAIAIVLLVPALIRAHPVPKLEYDRLVNVEIRPREIAVEYHLEIDQFTLFQEVGRSSSPYKLEDRENLTREDYARAMQARLRKTVPDGLFGKANGAPVKWTLDWEKLDFLDSVQFHFRFRAAIEGAPEPRAFQLEDLNFADKNGVLKLVFTPPEGMRIRSNSGSFEVNTKVGQRDRKPFRIEYEWADVTGNEPGPPIAEPKPELVAAPLWERVRRQGLAALLDSPNGLAVLLLVAALFGAAHALTPGHGKTLVAAYLVGERGTKFHAILLGLITTLSHTGGVILIALVLWRFYPETAPDSVRVLLGFVGGLLIAGLGLWLLMQRLLGRADHVHMPGIGHSHGAPVDNRRATMGRLILLGITGGMIPCWDAVLLLGVAISMQKVWLGVPLLFAFSAGLAAVLVAIGLGVVYAGQKVGGRWAESRIVKLLPIVSALIVVAIGLWLCRDALSPPRLNRIDRMRITAIEARIVRIPLKKPIRHASHVRTETDNLIVSCTTDDGRVGWGEGVPREYVTGESAEGALAMLQAADFAGQCGEWKQFEDAVRSIGAFHLPPVAGDDRMCRGNAARAAIEIALLDACGKSFGKSLSDVVPILAPSLYEPKDRVRYSTAITSAKGFKATLAGWKMRLYGFRQVKVKVGIAGQDDVDRMRRIRKGLGSKVDIRIDANEAWTVEETPDRVAELEPFAITSVEQPVAHESSAGLAAIKNRIRVPIMFDESLCSMADAERSIRDGLCDLFNIRLSKCGGFIPSLRLAEKALESGLGYQLGCQVGETAILSAAGRHFAASVRAIRYLEGSYDRHLVKESLGMRDITFAYGGRAPALAGPGLGIEIDPAALDRVTVRKEVLHVR